MRPPHQLTRYSLKLPERKIVSELSDLFQPVSANAFRHEIANAPLGLTTQEQRSDRKAVPATPHGTADINKTALRQHTLPCRCFYALCSRFSPLQHPRTGESWSKRRNSSKHQRGHATGACSKGRMREPPASDLDARTGRKARREGRVVEKSPYLRAQGGSTGRSCDVKAVRFDLILASG